jgi:DNA-binding LytR/AlgR family response regulator
MPGLNGLQVAQLLPGRSIIFTTAHDRFAADAFDLSAVDFIRKPISRERLERGLEKARERQQQRTAGGGMVQLMTDRGRTLVRWSEVLWVTTPEQEKRDKLLHLADGTVLRLKNSSLDQLLALFPEGAFARVNRSDIVALARVHLVADDVVQLRTSGAGKEPVRIQLGAAYKEAFLALMGAR